MYGNEIVPIGETGFGVSTTFGYQRDGAGRPNFTFFHISDGFRQALFTAVLEPPEDDNAAIPRIWNVFHDRCAEVIAQMPRRDPW